jgi:hypothetical protein
MTRWSRSFKDRNMRGEDVAKTLHLDVPEAYEKELGKIAPSHADLHYGHRPYGET